MRRSRSGGLSARTIGIAGTSLATTKYEPATFAPLAFFTAHRPGSAFIGELCLDSIPDRRRNVRAAEALDGANAGGRSHVDLGEIAVDHVDAGKHKPTHA